MKLTEAQITDVVVINPNKDALTKAKAYNKTLRTHLYGENLDTHVTEIKGFESPSIKELRAKYTKSNKDLFARAGRPIDKVFSARGGSNYYNLSDTADKTAMGYAARLKNGYSVKKWVESFWKPHLLDDPHGLIFMEVDEAGNVYPTYKAVTSIYDYQLTGTKVEYVVFTVTKEQKKAAGLKETDEIFRVYDDAYDYWVKKEQNKVTILKDFSYINEFGHVPAMLNSDLADPSKEGVISLFDEVIALADQYLLKGSIKVTHDFLHGFPKYWEYADTCIECNGATTITSTEGTIKCPTCKGTGKNIMSKVSDAKLLEYPADKETPMVTPNVAGYVSPDKTYYEIATAELSALEQAIHYTLWGSVDLPQTQGMATDGKDVKTATQIIQDQQPKIDRLANIADMAEKRHKFIIDHIIELKVRKGYIASGGASINYGRRFMIEGMDAIWERYSNARKNGAPWSVLDDLLNEYTETKYQGDHVSMAIELKLLSIEPFVHLTAQQVQTLNVSPEDYAAKVYYSEWRKTVNDATILSFDSELLKEQLYTYAKEKAAAIQKSEADKAKLLQASKPNQN